MRCYRAILVVADGSSDGDEAVRHATALALDQGARLVVMTVVPTTFAHPVDASTAAVKIDIAASWRRDHQRLVSSLPLGLSIESRIAEGHPPSAIVRAARASRCDLIVMRAQNRRWHCRAWLGSTSAAVVRRSDVPVLLIRAETKTAPDADRSGVVLAAMG
jgi:nucleotide-binding universal stress UspA family protein